VLLVGDSLAASLSPGLGPALASDQITMTDGWIVGCGATRGLVADDSGHLYPWATACDRAVPQRQRSTLNISQPDLVVWYSNWEYVNRVKDGRVLWTGSTAHDDDVLANMEDSLSRLSAKGARLALLSVPPTVDGFTRQATPLINARIAHLDSVLRTFASRHPGEVTMVNFSALVCDGKSPCPLTIDGVTIRPLDGAHLGPEGAAVVGPRLAAILANLDLDHLPVVHAPAPDRRSGGSH
jgi:hypothetical protein